MENQEVHMARFLKSRKATQGKIPGELVFVGRKKMDQLSIRIIQYNEERFEETVVNSLEEAHARLDDELYTWIDIVGLHDTQTIGRTEDLFGIHPLTLEDIVDTGQRPKVEEFDNYLNVIVKMMRLEPTDNMIHSEQLSLVWGADFLLTFQEREGDVFDPIRDRLRLGKGRIRRSGVDYLAYALLDVIVDNYMLLIERLGEQVESLEPQIIDDPRAQILGQINENRRELHFLRTSVRPARDALRELARLETDLVSPATFIFLRDLNDLVTQAVEAMDSYREMIQDQLDSHTASTGNRLNDVMKFLTVFSAIFIPLSLLAGIYGTNFAYIPELGFKYGYFIFWGALVVVAIVMVLVFKRKKWL
jgi:magnesium transporter